MNKKWTALWIVQHIPLLQKCSPTTELSRQRYIRTYITDESITKIIYNQLDIKLGQFTQEKSDMVRTKFKNRNAASLDEIPPEVWKTKKFDEILLWYCNADYNLNTIDRRIKGNIPPFPKKGDLGIAKSYKDITIISIAAKIYYALLLNRIEPEIKKILRKNHYGFRRNRSTTWQILTTHRILGSVRVIKPEAIFRFVDFP